MKYDVHLELEYEYDRPVATGHHLVRVMPMAVAGLQRVVVSSTIFEPMPAERSDGFDFFGNAVASVVYRAPARRAQGRHDRARIGRPGRADARRVAGSAGAAPRAEWSAVAGAAIATSFHDGEPARWT